MGIMGDLEPIGMLASTLDGATLAGTGSLSISGLAVATLEGTYFDAIGSLVIAGSFASVLEGCTLRASDAVFHPSPERISGVKSQIRVSKALTSGGVSQVPTSTRTSTVRR
jgi:hypothetical protein